MMFIVYMATNTKNGKMYVGKTCKGLENRRRGHIHGASKSKTYFSKALLKYGPASFEWKILYEGVDNREIEAVEKAMIAQHRTLSPHGYNCTIGGTGGMMKGNPVKCVETNRRWPNIKACADYFNGGGQTQLRRALNSPTRTFRGLHFIDLDGKHVPEAPPARRYWPNSTPVWCLETGEFWPTQTSCVMHINGNKATSHLYKCLDKVNRTWKGLHFVSHVG